MTEEIKEAILYLEHTSKDDFNLEEHQKENRIWAIKKLLNYITNLQKENERLKETLQTDKLMKAFMVEHNRNEKAIESIEDCKKTNGDKYTCIIDHNYLLNILQGGDE